MFSWIKWLNEPRAPQRSTTQLKTSGHTLVQEFLSDVEGHERLRERTRGALGLPWFQKYPKLQTIITTSELQQLECLCAQIPPAHAATVLSRFREVLATNAVRPWELAPVFNLVMRDILRQKETAEDDDQPPEAAPQRETEAWTSCYRVKQGFLTPIVPNCVHPREEIPTVSGYVDWAMNQASRGWGPPHYCPAPLRPRGTYSTGL